MASAVLISPTCGKAILHYNICSNTPNNLLPGKTVTEPKACQPLHATVAMQQEFACPVGTCQACTGGRQARKRETAGALVDGDDERD